MDKFLSADAIRTRFSQAMSAMYQQEVPQYGTLMQLVATLTIARWKPTARSGIGSRRRMRLTGSALSVTVPFAWARRPNWPRCASCLR